MGGDECASTQARRRAAPRRALARCGALLGVAAVMLTGAGRLVASAGAGVAHAGPGTELPPPSRARAVPDLHPRGRAARGVHERLLRERGANPALPEQFEECLQELVDKATKWWVADGRWRFPHEEAALVRQAAALLAREQRAACGEEEDPAETGRWAQPIIRPGWYMRPLYYKFDFDTFLFAQPLRAHPLDATLAGGTARGQRGVQREAVTLADLTKKLFKCAYKGQAKRARACVRAGANINAADFDHEQRLTPFLWAACGGSPQTLEALAQLGAGEPLRDCKKRGVHRCR
jgi:hypothetical protein